MLTRVKGELHMQAAVREKMQMDLSTALQMYAIQTEEIRKLGVEKVRFEMDKEVLEQEKAELQEQIHTMS